MNYRPIRRNASGYDPQRTIFLPHGGTIVAVGPVRWIGRYAKTGGPTHGEPGAIRNPHRPSGPWRMTAAEIVFGLKAGKKKPYPTESSRRYYPYEELSLGSVEKFVLDKRRDQLHREPGLGIVPVQGHYEGLPEDSIKIAVFPEGVEEDDAELFYEHIYWLSNSLADEYEQDQVIVNIVRGGVAEVFFLNWSDEPVDEGEQHEFVRRIRKGE